MFQYLSYIIVNVFVTMITGMLNVEQRQLSGVQKGIDSLQNDMIRMNILISNKKGEQYKLEQINVLIEKEFVHSLKVSSIHVHVYYT